MALLFQLSYQKLHKLSGYFHTSVLGVGCGNHCKNWFGMFPVKLFSQVSGMMWNISTEKITSSAVRHCYRLHFHILQNSFSPLSPLFLLCEWIRKCYQSWLWCCVLILMELLQKQQSVLASSVGIWAENPHSVITALKHLSLHLSLLLLTCKGQASLHVAAEMNWS